jgi:hypothetical protein
MTQISVSRGRGRISQNRRVLNSDESSPDRSNTSGINSSSQPYGSQSYGGEAFKAAFYRGQANTYSGFSHSGGNSSGFQNEDLRMPKAQKRKLPSFNRGKKLKNSQTNSSSLQKQSNDRQVLSQDDVV